MKMPWVQITESTHMYQLTKWNRRKRLERLTLPCLGSAFGPGCNPCNGSCLALEVALALFADLIGRKTTKQKNPSGWVFATASRTKPCDCSRCVNSTGSNLLQPAKGC